MPVLQGNLRKDEKESIRRNYTFLLDELDGKYLVDHLVEGEVFDFDDKEEICQQVSRRDRAELLLNKLLHSGPYQAYDVFLTALRKRYPHVAEKLEKTGKEGHVGELQEMYATHTSKEIEQKAAIIEMLKLSGNVFKRHLPDSYIPASSFNMRHLPAGYHYQEVVDCVHSLAEQTVLGVSLCDLSQISAGEKRWRCVPFYSGRVWRVKKILSTANNKTCPCKDCKGSTTPRKRWGEYIVITCSRLRHYVEYDNIRFVLGYDSHKKVSDVSVLKAVSVICSDDSLEYAEILCITHDADTSKRVEDICHRNNVNREKLLSRCHLLQKDKKLTVFVSHPDWGPKHISVGEWLEDEGDKTSGSSRHVYTAADRGTGRRGGPVLLLDGRNANVTLHYKVGEDPDVGYSCGIAWSL